MSIKKITFELAENLKKKCLINGLNNRVRIKNLPFKKAKVDTTSVYRFFPIQNITPGQTNFKKILIIFNSSKNYLWMAGIRKALILVQ